MPAGREEVLGLPFEPAHVNVGGPRRLYDPAAQVGLNLLRQPDEDIAELRLGRHPRSARSLDVGHDLGGDLRTRRLVVAGGRAPATRARLRQREGVIFC